MERRLERHPSVTRVKIVFLNSKQAGDRSALGVVAVLSAGGQASLKRSGHAYLAASLRRHLEKSFEISTLPRLFRFVRALPVDAQGKVPQSALLAFFLIPGSPADNSSHTIGEKCASVACAVAAARSQRSLLFTRSFSEASHRSGHRSN